VILLRVFTFAALISTFTITLYTEDTIYFTYAQGQKIPKIVMGNADHLGVELVINGLNSSNSAFLGSNDILVLDGSNGKVYRITNGEMLEEPLIDLNSFHQDGLIGIAISENENGPSMEYLKAQYSS